MFRMRLAGFRGMVVGMMAMARSGVGMVCRGLRIIFLIMLGGLAVMMRRFFVMLGRVLVMLAGGVFVRHGEPSWLARAQMTPAAREPRRGFATGLCRGMPFAQISFAPGFRNAATAARNRRHQTVARPAFDAPGFWELGIRQ
jgi:hypothetical protein